MASRRSPRAGGFTLVELLVVVVIIILISAATLPVIVPALTHRQVGEAARVLQANLVGARDAAIRANAPRGIRLLPAPSFPGFFPTNPPTNAYLNPLAANRMIAIEPATDYSEGYVSPAPPQLVGGRPGQWSIPIAYTPGGATVAKTVIVVYGPTVSPGGLYLNPTSWYWNIRRGEQIRINDSGGLYTVVGPMNSVQNGLAYDPTTNPEGFINEGGPGSVPQFYNTVINQSGTAVSPPPEVLFLVNSQDDNNNGYVDEGFDGLDNDGNGYVDDLNENEGEAMTTNERGYSPYTISRRPVVSPQAREVALPSSVVIDMTTWNTIGQPERSRLPVDPYTHYVDIMLDPNGRVVPTVSNGSVAMAGAGALPFYHFWLTEREDVVGPLWGAYQTPPPFPVPPTYPYLPNTNANMTFLLPLPADTPGYPGGQITSLKGDRRLVTLFTRTGLITTNEVTNFSLNDPNAPFYDAQAGTREAK